MAEQETEQQGQKPKVIMLQGLEPKVIMIITTGDSVPDLASLIEGRVVPMIPIVASLLEPDEMILALREEKRGTEFWKSSKFGFHKSRLQ